MRYLPKSDDERRQMLAEIGARSIDDLFAMIPAEYRLDRDLNVPRQQAESEIIDVLPRGRQEERHRLRELSGRRRLSPLPSRDHRLASAARRVSYQLHAVPGRDHAGHTAGHLRVPDHDCRAHRHGRGQRQHVRRLYRRGRGGDDGHARHRPPQGCGCRDRSSRVPRSAGHLSRHRRLPTALVGYDNETGRVDLEALDAAVTAETAAVLVQSPNFFGVIEDIPAIAEIAHAKGALLIVSIAEAVSLGIVRPPVEADIVSMEAQSFGVALSYGGPFCGVIAAKEQFVRQMPGRLAGQTVDGAGNRGFVLTLATREQHIRREKATSNICTNQALVALMATIFLAVYGKEGMRELAEHNLAKADYAAKTLAALPAQSCASRARRASTSLCCRPTKRRRHGAGGCSTTKSSAASSSAAGIPSCATARSGARRK